MRFLLRLFVIFIVVSAALSMVRRFLTVLAPRPEPRLRSSAGGRLVKDPVCGTYIPEETALQARNQFFCSEECRGKYLAT